MSSGGRYLIVNADDFGQSSEVNRGIIQGFENGIVTSASLMVRWPAAVEAADYARRHGNLSVGLHVDLGEWAYRKGDWAPLYEVVPMELEAIGNEVQAQLETFRRIVGGDPTHFDSHQHIHRDEPARSVLLAVARETHVPLRSSSPLVNYCGRFYGQTNTGDSIPEAISVESLMDIVRTLPPGVTELACHPGFNPDLDTMYRKERELEVNALCDPRIRQFIAAEKITLCSFREAPLFGR